MSDRAPAFQDLMLRNHCFGCGPDNSGGLRIKSYWTDDGRSLCRFDPRPHHSAGPADIVCGGIIATVIDCHCICTAIADAYRRENRDIGTDPAIWFVTGALQVSYKAATPIDSPFELFADVAERTDRKSVVRCELISADEIRAQAEVIAVRVREQG